MLRSIPACVARYRAVYPVVVGADRDATSAPGADRLCAPGSRCNRGLGRESGSIVEVA